MTDHKLLTLYVSDLQKSVLPFMSQRAKLMKDAFVEAYIAQMPYQQQLLAFATAFQQFIPFDFIEFGRNNRMDEHIPWLSFLRIGSSDYQTIDTNSLLTITTTKKNLLDEWRRTCPSEVHPAFSNWENFSPSLAGDAVKRLYAHAFNLKSNLVFPVLVDHGAPFIVSFYSRNEEAYSADTLQLFGDVQFVFTRSLSRALTLAIPGQPAKPGPPRGLLGESGSMSDILKMVEHLSAVDTTVLILGETGTGKERVAQEIHCRSARRDHPLVKVNCAALPAGVIESELFGHEKGAFTDAVAKRLGRLEQANGGTVFLDEIGEIPLETQSLLLRFLQEKEIQPIGSQQTTSLDVRVIAATNKDLQDAIRKGEFRMDLYYRLNVFPILLPPLRERPEDIPILARHFLHRYGARHRKGITEISPNALSELSAYSWPGNVRELENCMERTVILTMGNIIDSIFLEPTPLLDVANTKAIKTLAENEREYIQKVLKLTKNRIAGTRGAAALLDLPASTLISRMKKLGIKK